MRATVELLRRQGYHATGVSEIVERSGAPRGSLYFLFPGGKEELAVTAMARAGEQLRQAIEAVLSSSGELHEVLARLVDGMAAGLAASGYEQGCPLATVTLEAAATSEPIQRAAQDAYGSWVAALESRLLAGGVEPEAAARKAVMILAALEGALLLARARRDTSPLSAIREEILALV